MSSIDSLLNHEPAPEQRCPSRPSLAKPTTFSAADALTTLATLGGGQQYVPASTAYPHPPRRTSSIGSYVAPVEPSPPIDQLQAHSPTLDHYHHGSKSPEEQRRQSLLTRTSPAPVLAPIQSLTGALHDRLNGEPEPSASPYGKDVSQMVPPPSRGSDEGASGRDGTQNRQPGFVRHEPTTAQIREPDSMNNTPHPISTNVPLSQESEQLPSPVPVIKNESSLTPREATPSVLAVPSSERKLSITTESMDQETRKAIEALKQNDLGLRNKRTASLSESVTSPVETKAPAPSKKRPAPASSSIKKKGTAALKKPTSKKRKLDTDADPNPRSVTPTSRPGKPSKGGKKGSQAGTPAAESSPAPDNSSQAHASDEEADSSDDNTLYCICRKPDNHKWMIGCDGGCDDWFHGTCVDMLQADEDLVDRFICPNCETAGRGETTWKRMCRRESCRKPALLAKNKQSKYCSDECGVLFFQEQLQRTAGARKTTKRPRKKGTKEGEDQTHVSEEDEEPTPLGGVLRAKDLKALTTASKDIEAFKRLGSGVLSPPQTASPTKATFDGIPNGALNVAEDLPLTPTELAHLNALHTEKTLLKDKLEVLKDREKFVSMAREQATRYAEKEKIKVKEFCGYDPRLSWSDPEFKQWRKSRQGRAAFKFNTLAPTAEQMASLDTDGDVQTNGVNGKGKEKEAVCIKKRCPKHPQWQKQNLQDARFEEIEVVESIKECEKEERSVRERARRRGQKDAMEAEIVGGEKRDEKNREGWVEMVAQPP